MRHRRNEVFVHLVWSTWDRAPSIPAAELGSLHACLQAEAETVDAEVLAVGGTTDHVHLLVRLAPTCQISRLARQVKGASSHWINHELNPAELFRWQRGYAAISVSPDNVKRVCRYIQDQPRHHADESLDDDLEPMGDPDGRPLQ